MSPLIPLAACLLSPILAGEIRTVPPLAEPVSAVTPVLSQLRLDLAALQSSAVLPQLPVSVLTTPEAFAGLQKAVDDASRLKAPEIQTDALRRVELAQQVLGRFDPNEFAKLPEAQQESTLSKLWTGWKDRGLVDAGTQNDPGGTLDRLIVAGVEDRALTSANKSSFLAVGVLGYPLADSLWLMRTRIGDALEENTLNYPRGQRWHTDDHTPEFLGTTREAQSLVDTWGGATDFGRQIVAAVKEGKSEFPKSAVVSPAAASAFAAVARELKENKDDAALAYLSGQDPTFSAFLLDAKKPGYYLYNGDKSVVARIMATKAASALGVRRINKPDGDKVHASTYFYRPARVAQRLASMEKLKVDSYDDDARKRLAEYGRRAAALAGQLP